MCYNYARKYVNLLDNPSMLEVFSKSKKNNVLKALIALAKYHGFYTEYRQRIKDYGITWSRASSIDSFLRIFSNHNTDILNWCHTTGVDLEENYKTYLRFLLLSGMRASEAIESFNLTRNLKQKGKLSQYYNEDLGTLEHFRHQEKFLRGTKNVYITMVPKSLVIEISSQERVSYSRLRKRLQKRGSLRLNELRDFYATFMVRHNLIREEVDLLKGRIGESVFTRHYFSPAIKELKNRVLKALSELNQLILSQTPLFAIEL